MDEKGQIVLTDFGQLRFTGFKINQDEKTFFGTPEYLSPETLKGHGFSQKTDYWSLGILM